MGFFDEIWIRDGFHEYVAVNSWEADRFAEERGLAPLDRAEARFRVVIWMRGHPEIKRQLVQAVLRPTPGTSYRLDADERLVEDAFYHEWKLFKLPALKRQPVKIAEETGSTLGPVPEIAPAEERPAVAPTHWLAIELVDEAGSPVPNVAYRVEGADGRVYRGTLDNKGKARVENLPSSEPCRVSFPELDGREWRAA